jgi:hypothetical protein
MADSNADVAATLSAADSLHALLDCSPLWRFGPQPVKWAGAREMESEKSPEVSTGWRCCRAHIEMRQVRAHSAASASKSTFILNSSC